MKKVTQSFSYLGHTFTPHETKDVLSILNPKKKTVFNIAGFNHGEFYRAAAEVGAEKYNSFLCNGHEMVPCSTHLLICEERENV